MLESWDKAGSPSQVRLDDFLASLAGWFDDVDGEIPLALDLKVSLPPNKPVASGGHDLDNYLLPIVRRYGHHRFFAVFGRKAHGATSTLAIEPAVRAEDQSWSPQMICRTRSSGQSAAWKHEVAEACAPSAPTHPVEGPIALQIHYRLSARRNWAQQWKPTIDALGAVLGVADPARPFNADDDRIVDLMLSRTIDETLGWDIEVQVGWASAS